MCGDVGSTANSIHIGADRCAECDKKMNVIGKNYEEILFIFFHGNPLYSYSNERCMILYRNTVLQVCRPDTLLHFKNWVSIINYPSLDTRNHF